jgi:hypothetical protein
MPSGGGQPAFEDKWRGDGGIRSLALPRIRPPATLKDKDALDFDDCFHLMRLVKKTTSPFDMEKLQRARGDAESFELRTQHVAFQRGAGQRLGRPIPKTIGKTKNCHPVRTSYPMWHPPAGSYQAGLCDQV